MSSYFPFVAYRGDQAEIIEQVVGAVQDGWQYVELAAPTAAGKTAIMYTAGCELAYDHNHRVCYTSTQVNLIEQLPGWSYDLMPKVTGTVNYDCADGGNAHDCDYTAGYPVRAAQIDDGCDASTETVSNGGRRTCPHVKPFIDQWHVKDGNLAVSADCECDYVLARSTFDRSPFGATTLAMALYDPRILKSRDVIFIDESASLEAALIEHSKLEIHGDMAPVTPSHWRQYIRNLESDIETVLDVAERCKLKNDPPQKWFQKLGAKTFALQNKIQHQELELKKLHKYLNNLLRKMQQWYPRIDTLDKQYIETSGTNGRPELKLIYGKQVLNDIFGNRQLIFASGTPTTKLLVEPAFIRRIEMQHPIARERRSVMFVNLGCDLTKNSTDRVGYNTVIQTMADAIRQIEQVYGKKHTLVHCIARTNAEAMYPVLQSMVDCPVYLQDRYNRDAALNNWKQQRGRAILLSIGREEGLDLPGPEFNLNFVLKTPWAFLGDKAVKARLTKDNAARDGRPQEFAFMAAVRLQQACGRCTRAPDDFSRTFVLERLNDGVKQYLEPWFREAIIQGRLEDAIGDE